MVGLGVIVGLSGRSAQVQDGRKAGKKAQKKEDDMNHSYRPPENNSTDVGLHQCDDAHDG